MKSEKAKSNPAANPAAATRKLPMLALAVATIVLALGLWLNRSEPPTSTGPRPGETGGGDASTAPATSKADPGFQKLVGRWIRPDGGYVIQIRGVDDDGKLDAAYFNPNPIPVEKAEATRVGSVTKVFVVLGGANYNGSTYTLLHESESDKLKGIYHQAVAGQQFEIEFDRMR